MVCCKYLQVNALLSIIKTYFSIYTHTNIYAYTHTKYTKYIYTFLIHIDKKIKNKKLIYKIDKWPTPSKDIKNIYD